MEQNILLQSINISLLKEQLQAIGYRVSESEQNGTVQLLSASQGIGFAVRFGNAAQEEDEWLDFTFSCVLRVEGGSVPDGLVGQWNQEKRFSRLTTQGQFLVLEMDCVLAGGVSQAYLRANIELWERLMQEFLLYLRNYSNTHPATSLPVDNSGAVAVVDENVTESNKEDGELPENVH